MAKKLTSEHRTELLQTLKKRFDKHPHRHEEIEWEAVRIKLEEADEKLWSLYEMERTGGEPDVVGYSEEEDEFLFMDCSKQSPKGRRSVCYDGKAQASRKKNPPENNAVDMAEEMGIDLLTEAQYRYLQGFEEFDTTTSSWVKTPSDIREKGGAVFCDLRYGRVFVYHNGADSYYAARGFRGLLKV